MVYDFKSILPNKSALIAVVLLCVSGAANSVEVIANHGAEPIRPILNRILGENEKKPVEVPDNVSQMTKMLVFPFEPATATVGRWESKDFEKPMDKLAIRPLAIIGSDPVSLAWLHANLSQLQTLSAGLVVVEAKSAEDIRKITGIYGQEVYPAQRSDSLLQQYHITHYPVLITENGVYQ